nr:MAG TPA: hypothetical protein [Caudoviricetes sp.]
MVSAILCVSCVTILLIELTITSPCVNRACMCVWVGLIHS